MTIARCYHVDRKKGRCRRSYHWGGLHVYAELPKVGAKKIREHASEGIFREEVGARVWCEAQAVIAPEGGWWCWDRPHIGVDAHHLEPNDRDAGRHDPARAIWICRVAHDRIHAHPEAAQVVGLLRPFREAL